MRPRTQEESDAPGHRDTQGLYRALRLRTTATYKEIQLAYEMLTDLSDGERGASLPEIQRAYSVLINPHFRVAYDKVCLSTTKVVASKPGRRRLDDWRILLGCIILFFAIIGFVWIPLYGNRFKTFVAGDNLIDSESGAPFGVVVETSAMHEFPQGIRLEAILVDLHDGDLQWFPAADIRATCRKAK